MGRKLPETLDEAELFKILKVTKQEHHKLAFALGFYQAMRISEIVNLKPENIDFGQKLIRIKQGKGDKDRNIPIAPQLIRKIKNLPIQCGVRALEIAFKRSLGKTNIKKDLHFHSLRHGGATYYLNVHKWDIRHVQVFLGHSRLDTTQIYVHVTPKDLIDKMWDEN